MNKDLQVWVDHAISQQWHAGTSRFQLHNKSDSQNAIVSNAALPRIIFHDNIYLLIRIMGITNVYTKPVKWYTVRSGLYLVCECTAGEFNWLCVLRMEIAFCWCDIIINESAMLASQKPSCSCCFCTDLLPNSLIIFTNLI